MINIDDVCHHYAIAALWSSTDADGEPLDVAYDVEDIAYETMKSMHADCQKFCTLAGHLIMRAGLSTAQVGHDFWLTRNHHGAGFWDRGHGSTGETLTKLAHGFKECELYVSDNGKVCA